MKTKTTMKTARSNPASVWVNCPYCGEGLPHPSGSLLWPTNETYPPYAPVVTCFYCQKTSQLPAALVGGPEGRGRAR